MQASKRSTVCILILCALIKADAQGAFQNLDFELASVAPAPANYTPSDAYNPISAASAFPDWTVSEDGTICTAVWGSPAALDETSVALVSGGSNPIQGNYSVQLTAYANAPSGLYKSSSISQTGLIPIGSQSIQFLIPSPPQAGRVPPNPEVTINGTAIGLTVLSQFGGVMTMGGNVGAFAGDTVNLSFVCQATPGASFPADENYFNLDGIQFSSTAVPEPNSIALFGLGGLFMALFQWRKTSPKM